MVQKIVIGILILLGIFLRTYQIGTIPPGLFSDETALAINAKTIAQKGVDEFGKSYPFGFESYADFKLPGYIYTSSIVYNFLGPSILTIRLTALLAGILSIISIGYLAYVLFPKQRYIGPIATTILSINLYHIHFSRIAYETMLATFFLSLYLIALVKVLKSKNKFLWVLVGSLTATMSMWTYPAPQFIIPVFTFALLFCCLLLKPQEIERKNIFTAGLFLIVIVIIFYPLLANPNVSKRPLGYVFSGGGLLGLWQKSVDIFASWIRIFNLEFLFLKGDLFGFRHGTKESGQLLPLFLLPLITGWYVLIKEFHFKKFSYLFLTLLLIISGLPSALTYDQPYSPRLLPVIIPFTILLSLGTEKILLYIARQKKLYAYAAYLLISLVLIYQLCSFAHTYFVHFAEKSKYEFQPAGTAVIDYLREARQTNNSQRIYYLQGVNCMPWGHDELRLWYLLDLPNDEMISWNNEYKNIRDKTGNPFGAFDHIPSPKGIAGNIVLNASIDEIKRAAKNSLIVYCGNHRTDIDETGEKVVKEFYLLEDQKRDLIYFVTKKLH